MSTKKPTKTAKAHALAEIKKSFGGLTTHSMATERHNAISPRRELIEQAYKNAGAKGLTTPELRDRLDMDPTYINNTIQTLKHALLIFDTGSRHINKSRLAWHEFRPRAAYRPTPIRASNQPNGSTNYWRQFEARIHTPARVELLQNEEATA